MKTNANDLALKVQLIQAKIEILKMKANAHDWVYYVPNDVKEELEKSLLEIDVAIKALNEGE